MKINTGANLTFSKNVDFGKEEQYIGVKHTNKDGKEIEVVGIWTKGSNMEIVAHEDYILGDNFEKRFNFFTTIGK
jgi:hypothetical protein